MSTAMPTPRMNEKVMEDWAERRELHSVSDSVEGLEGVTVCTSLNHLRGFWTVDQEVRIAKSCSDDARQTARSAALFAGIPVVELTSTPIRNPEPYQGHLPRFGWESELYEIDDFCQLIADRITSRRTIKNALEGSTGKSDVDFSSAISLLNTACDSVKKFHDSLFPKITLNVQQGISGLTALESTYAENEYKKERLDAFIKLAEAFGKFVGLAKSAVDIQIEGDAGGKELANADIARTAAMEAVLAADEEAYKLQIWPDDREAPDTVEEVTVLLDSLVASFDEGATQDEVAKVTELLKSL
ncbi:uncharacterized protein MKK02DRAFT_41599 [Dioszegia hungarica]|uniref:Uncharacterized protein n=1 Tax=Dioszegia hungarica TaxID=4972 RepID=A0AA38H3B7_9TREE|nr:uncharacterized protein MKK02DRAFT_41599 [Dioszegia hungarica]KAI9631961.1 hypothetical protein MKK02DRAFT_41599 [Dioszegia hungarica]